MNRISKLRVPKMKLSGVFDVGISLRYYERLKNINFINFVNL